MVKKLNRKFLLNRLKETDSLMGNGSAKSLLRKLVQNDIGWNLFVVFSYFFLFLLLLDFTIRRKKGLEGFLNEYGGTPFEPIVNIDPNDQLTDEEYTEKISKTLFFKLLDFIVKTTIALIIFSTIFIILILVVVPIENLFIFIENWLDNTSQIVNDTANKLRQKNFTDYLRIVFHSLKEFFHSLREAKESVGNLGKEIIQLWKEA